MKKELFKFYKTYRLYIFPAIVGISSIFLIVFAIYPQTVRLISNQKKAGDLITKTKFLDDKVSALESYDSEELASKMKAVLNTFPQEKDFADAFGVLSQLAAGSGFSVISLSLENTSMKTAGSSSFGVKMALTGSRELLQNLLNNLENSPRLLKISSIDSSLNPASSATNVSLSLEVLYSSSSYDAGTPDTPLSQLNPKDDELIAKLKEINTVLPKSVQISQRGKINPFD